MSQENVEIIRGAHGAFNRRDLDAFLEFVDPEVEFITRFANLEGHPQYHGHDGIREWWQDLLAIFPDFNSEVLEVRDSGDRGITALRLRGHGLDSGTPLDERAWQAWKARDGKVLWWRFFGSEAEALEAAGLQE